MQLFITILHIVLAIFMILIILLQPGKEGGAALAGGSSGNQMYGPRGAGNFLGRATTIVATMFMFTSIPGLVQARTKSGGLQHRGRHQACSRR